MLLCIEGNSKNIFNMGWSRENQAGPGFRSLRFLQRGRTHFFHIRLLSLCSLQRSRIQFFHNVQFYIRSALLLAYKNNSCSIKPSLWSLRSFQCDGTYLQKTFLWKIISEISIGEKSSLFLEIA